MLSGDLINPGSEAGSLSGAVRVSLLAEGGAELETIPVFAGSGFELDLLREASIEELQRNQQDAARVLVTQQIEPGESTRFLAAFVSLPQEASHFRLTAVAESEMGL